MLQNRLKAENSEDARLKKSCEDFEAIFISYMLKTMRSTIPKDTQGASGNQKEIFESMFDQALANEISSSNQSLGIGKELYKELSRRLERMNPDVGVNNKKP